MNNPLTKSILLCGVGLLLASHPATFAQTGSFSEPATVFYGKVIGTGSEQPFMIYDGNLAWTITRHDGTEVQLSASLFKLDDGTYSYRLDVPHAALAIGLETPGTSIPLPPVPEVHVHERATLNGSPALFLGPAPGAFTTEQLLRTATYRMDLAVGWAAIDTDGDGIPDWWEELHGFDKQDAADAGVVVNGDGLTALEAYLAGLDPNHDHRRPELLTSELIVYPSGLTAVLLDSRDLDSDADQISYTLTSLPSSGSLILRGSPADDQTPGTALSVGASFTQADLLNSRVVFRAGAAGAEPGSFGVEVRDEQGGDASDSALVRLVPFVAPELVADHVSALEASRIDNAEYAGLGYVVVDGSTMPDDTGLSAFSAGLSGAELDGFVALNGVDRRHVLLASEGNALQLRGGHQDDVILLDAGRGTLAGGEGADRFVFRDLLRGSVVVEDFSVTGQDIIDLSSLGASSGYLHQYLRITNAAGTYTLQLDVDGNGAGFTNLAVALPGLSAADADLYRLVAAGRLDVGELALQPRVSIVASVAGASENGPTPGQFLVTREGNVDDDVSVTLAISGTAANGSDYALIASSLVIPAGQSSATIEVSPYADGLTEVAEFVTISLQAGTGYRVGTAASATVSISDQMMVVGIETIDALAVKESGVPGAFMITRRDVVDRDVLIRLQISGTAANGTDYNTISSSLLMPRGQSIALLEIHPKAGAVISGGLETAVITIRTDAAYLIEQDARSATVSLIEREENYEQWLARTRDGAGEVDPSDTPDESSITLIERFAYGLDAHAPGSAGLPRLERSGADMLISFRRPPGVQGVDYRVTGFRDLMDTEGTAIGLEAVPAPAGNADPQRMFYRLTGVEDAATAFTVIELDWER